ncbi:hypothetical protein [Parasitella parasitica]|uniref:Myb-like domain-containing protein n=1 Tax=Parasitella parasitica TaxID=35722 RepID=A0A0B7MNF4_9FUNG|nr:hypothetical protein [Parasitella parasitica]
MNAQQLNAQELNAIDGLLGLCSYNPYQQNASRVSLHSQASHPSLARLNPIIPNDTGVRLPSIAQVLSSPPSMAFTSPSSSAASSTCSLNFILSSPMCPSMSSCSSSASSIASSFSEQVSQQAMQRTERRKALCVLNRRGRPKKNHNNNNSSSNVSNSYSSYKKFNEIKIIQSEYEKAVVTIPKPIGANVISVTNKPRWQEAERISLIEAIVQEKELDDMTTIPWDKVSKAVGRAKKACKDQWRREILPHLLKGFVRPDHHRRSNSNNNDTDRQQ